MSLHAEVLLLVNWFSCHVVLPRCGAVPLGKLDKIARDSDPTNSGSSYGNGYTCMQVLQITLNFLVGKFEWCG